MDGNEGGGAGTSSGSGGIIATGGSNASGGVGGTGAASGCPATAPEDGDDCDPDDVDGPCRYTGSVCTCGGFLGGGGDEWSCLGDGDECPESVPEVGSSCDQNGGGAFLCPYTQGICACLGDEWRCLGGN
jgi:hypothetical protein